MDGHTQKDAAPRPTAYLSREDEILRRSAGQDVLHLGFLAETDRPLAERLEQIQSPSSLHSRLQHVARRLVGVDIDEGAIAYLREHGMTDVYAGDVERLDQSDVPRSPPYSVVLAGDIIEHLGNPASMLVGVQELLAPNGTMIVTTPNSFGLPNYLRFVRGSFREGQDHVQSYSAYTLAQLLDRYGWDISEIYSSYQSRAGDSNSALTFRLGRALLEKAPKFGGTLFVVCRIRPSSG